MLFVAAPCFLLLQQCARLLLLLELGYSSLLKMVEELLASLLQGLGLLIHELAA